MAHFFSPTIIPHHHLFRDRYAIEKAGTGWDRLGQAGTGWDRNGEIKTSLQHLLVP
jgi:hypothetical protein